MKTNIHNDLNGVYYAICQARSVSVLLHGRLSEMPGDTTNQIKAMLNTQIEHLSSAINCFEDLKVPDNPPITESVIQVLKYSIECIEQPFEEFVGLSEQLILSAGQERYTVELDTIFVIDKLVIKVSDEMGEIFSAYNALVA